jgi:hypothetical protein
MVSGTHEVLHLVQCIREIGPLKFNLFPFEELNRNITRLIHGMDLVGDEFITKWSINKNLSLMIQNKYVYNNKYYDFIKKTFSIKSSNLKKKGSNLYNFDFCNRLKEENLNLGLNHRNFLQLNFKNMNELTFYKRLKINDNIYER